MKKAITTLALFASCSLINAQSYEWAKANTGNGTAEMAIDIAIDQQKNVYTVGYFNGTTDFMPGSGTVNLTTAGVEDAFIQKLDSLGNYVWAVRIGGTGADIARSVAINSAGEVIISGTFTNQVDMNPGTSTNNFGSASTGTNSFILKLSSAGTYINCIALAGTGTEAILDLQIDGTDAIYTTGYFMGTVDFDPGAGTANFSSFLNTEDIFIAKYNSNLTYNTAIALGSGNTDIGYGLAFDPSGNLLATGEYRGTVDFDPSGVTNSLTCISQQDVFVAKYPNNLSSNIYAKSFSGTNNEKGYAIVSDNAGNAYITGEFAGKVDFNPSTAAADTLFFTSGASSTADAFLVKLDPSGNLVWADQIARMNMAGGVYGRSLAIDPQNNIYMTGDFQGYTDFDPSGDTASITWGGNRDMYIAKYDQNGNYLWAFNVGSNMADMGRCIVYDSRSLFVSGYFTSSVDFNPSTAPSGGTNLLTSSGSTPDSYVARYSADCVYPTYPTITVSSTVFCLGTQDSVLMYVSGGQLNGATDWGWYDATCTGTLLATGDSLTVGPVGTVTYYLHATGCPRLEYIACIPQMVSGNSVNATVTASGNVLNANFIAGGTYQWVDCNNNYAFISGATGQSYTATTSGDYAVIATQFGCIDTSACTNITITSIENANPNNNTIQLFPNPAHEQLTITCSEETTIAIVNILGQELITRKNYKTETLDISTLESGVYYVKDLNSGKTIKFIKQ